MGEADRVLILRVPEDANIVSVTFYREMLPMRGRFIVAQGEIRPSDQGLTVGDVLHVVDETIVAVDRLREDAEHQGPSKQAHYRRLADEVEEAAGKLRAAVQ